MAYTHTFHIQMNGTDIEGEISFNGGRDVLIKTDTAVETSMSKGGAMMRLMTGITRAIGKLGGITKLEVLKK